MIPKFVIMEYGVAEGTSNPFNYDPWKSYSLEKRPITNAEKSDQRFPMSIKSCEHMSKIVGVINKYRKFDFEIVSLPYMYAEEYLLANRDSVFVVSASVGGFFNDEFMSQFKNDFYMAISAGNEGLQGEGLGATKPYWTAIGAVSPMMMPAEYSSWGKGLVSHVGISNEEIKYVYFGEKREYIQGTSFACPQHATQIMNLMMSIYNRHGSKPSVKDVLKLRDKYTKDIILQIAGVGVGSDLRTGKGYYEWKVEDGYMSEIKLRIGSNDIVVTENGVTSTVKSPIPAQTINGSTVLPLRVLAEILGLSVQYEPITKTVTLLKA